MKTILVLGATGFTGKRVASELSRISNVRYIIAGRDSLKLDALKDSLKGNLPFKTIIVDTSSYIQLEDALKGITVCINCVGPFRFHGEKVVETCINLNVHYVDINGETEFLENMHLKYDNLAKQSKTTIVSCCGFDCIPSDIGLDFVKKQYAKCNFYPSSAEVFIELHSDPKLGSAINYATYESAIESISNISKLNEIRRKSDRAIVPKYGPILKVHKKPRFDKRIGKHCIPFPGADSAIVRMGQSISLKSPIQFAIYLTTQTYWGMIGLIIFGSILNFLSTFAIGRYILLSFPELFSFGTFKKSGPTQAQIENSSFTTTFYTKGSSNPDLINGIPCKLNFEMVVKVTGPEMGYVTTPICVVQCALLFLDGGVIPFGVHTPASAFSETDLISRLDRRGVKFTVVQEKLH